MVKILIWDKYSNEYKRVIEVELIEKEMERLKNEINKRKPCFNDYCYWKSILKLETLKELLDKLDYEEQTNEN